MSELRACARISYNALNFDNPVNFGRKNSFLRASAKTNTLKRNLHGRTESDLGNRRALREFEFDLCDSVPDPPDINRDLAGSRPGLKNPAFIDNIASMR